MIIQRIEYPLLISVKETDVQGYITKSELKTADSAYQAMIKQAASLRQNHEQCYEKLNEVKDALAEKHNQLLRLNTPIDGV